MKTLLTLLIVLSACGDNEMPQRATNCYYYELWQQNAASKALPYVQALPGHVRSEVAEQDFIAFFSHSHDLHNPSGTSIGTLIFDTEELHWVDGSVTIGAVGQFQGEGMCVFAESININE